MKILVVDDNEANRKLLGWLLEDDGHDVVEAIHGQDAIDKFPVVQPDLILMDVMMPVVDGFQATSTIKQLLGPRHVPIIFLTALTDEASLAKCLSIGGDDFISKPINEQVLQAKIKAHSRIKELNEQIHESNLQLKKLHHQIVREHEIAKTVFENALSRSFLNCKNLRTFMSPATTFNGDLLLAAASPSGGLYLLVADFTGHGLPAAIGALPLSENFFNAAAKGLSVSDIARTLNRTLQHFLPDDMFAAATIAELNSEATRLHVWSGGMPELLITDRHGAFKTAVPSVHMPLGVLDDHEFERDIHVLRVDQGDRVYFYTDGIPEARNDAGEIFGDERLRAFFDGTKADPFNALIEEIHGFASRSNPRDDTTVMELECTPLGLVDMNAPLLPDTITLPWKMEMRLFPEELRQSNLVPQILDLIGGVRELGRHKDYLHTVLAELYSNSLEHGVLRLKSTLKSTDEGYLEYYRQRDEKLAMLTDGWVNISVELKTEGEAGILLITFKDSGEGFDINARRRSNDTNNDAFGRGVSLLEELCETVEYSENGTRVQVEYRIF